MQSLYFPIFKLSFLNISLGDVSRLQTEKVFFSRLLYLFSTNLLSSFKGSQLFLMGRSPPFPSDSWQISLTKNFLGKDCTGNFDITWSLFESLLFFTPNVTQCKEQYCDLRLYVFSVRKLKDFLLPKLESQDIGRFDKQFILLTYFCKSLCVPGVKLTLHGKGNFSKLLCVRSLYSPF